MFKSLQIVGNARYGGATYLMLEWSKYLLEKGCDVHILATDEIMCQKALAIDGVRVLNHIYMPREIKPLLDSRAFFQMLACIHKEKYHVVHTYTAVPSFLGRIAARLINVPVIVNHQGGWSVNPQSSLIERMIFTPLEYAAILASTKNICVSHAEADIGRQLRIAPKHKLVTIVNGMNPTPFVQAVSNSAGPKLRRKLGISLDCFLIGNTGRLVAGKGNEDLIAAFAILKDKYPQKEMKLLLAGEGVDRPQIEALIQQLQLDDDVRLLGFFEDIPAFLAALDLFVMPSYHEGLSVSLLEAMAAGCAIIATSIPPNAEPIKHERTGLLVPVAAPEEIAEAATHLIEHPKLAATYGANAQQRILDYYTLDRMFTETWNLYVALLGLEPPQPFPVHPEVN